MIVRGKNRCPSVEQLSQLLHPTARLNRWEQHLSDCPRCRETLCFLAGEATWWNEAADTLGAPAWQPPPATSIRALVSAGQARGDNELLCEHELQQLQQLVEPASHPELIGRIGRYELEQLVGRGGMGLVFRARDVELQRVVAVKTLAVHLIPLGAARERFIREARATASLSHPHIVPVYDVITDGAVPAIVMQYITGPTLQQHLSERGPWPWQEVLQLGIQLSDALTIAHERGLVHRDIKPGNVLLEAGGSRALLTDFGLVRALDDATLTRSGVLAGTPDYMSPEQARGHSVSHASDLFSLGALLYAMLTGHPPFRADNPMAVMNRICHQAHRAVAESHPEIPREVSGLVDRLLSKHPKRRLASAAEVTEELQRLARAQPRLFFRGRRKQQLTAVMACLLVLLGAVVWFPQWPEWEATQSSRDRVPRNPSAVEVTPATPEPDASPPWAQVGDEMRTWPADAPELRRIDQQLESLRQELEHVSAAPLAPSSQTGQPSDSMLNRLDGQIDLLHADAQRLMLELQTE